MSVVYVDDPQLDAFQNYKSLNLDSAMSVDGAKGT